MSWKQSFSTRQPTFSSSAQDLLFESNEENNDPFAEEVETQLDPDFVAPIVVYLSALQGFYNTKISDMYWNIDIDIDKGVD